MIEIRRLLLGAALFAGAGRAGITLNGNFATGDMTGWTTFTSDSSTTTTGAGLPSVTSPLTSTGGAFPSIYTPPVDCSAGQVVRGSLDDTANNGVGTPVQRLQPGQNYVLALMMQRPYQSAIGVTPDEYVTNLQVVPADQGGAPEPSALLLAGVALLTAAVCQKTSTRRKQP